MGLLSGARTVISQLCSRYDQNICSSLTAATMLISDSTLLGVMSLCQSSKRPVSC
jgi:hypothetical protein